MAVGERLFIITLLEYAMCNKHSCKEQVHTGSFRRLRFIEWE